MVRRVRRYAGTPGTPVSGYAGYDGEDKVGRFLRATLGPTLLYAARVTPEIAHNIDDVDRAMRWGFGWELGPFETWDAIGIEQVLESCRVSEPPPLVRDALACGAFRPRRPAHSFEPVAPAGCSVTAAARGVPSISEFFTEALAHEVARVAGPADLIVGCNVLGHIDDLDDVCRGLKALLADNGAFIFEVPYLGDMVDRLEYDTIYHEHLSYFAVRPLELLFRRHGLRLERVEFVPVHGGSVRGTVVHGQGVSSLVARLIEAEAGRRLGERASYEDLAREVPAHRNALRNRLEQLKDEGSKVIGYGAPAKGSVVLNYCEIGTDLVPVVLDSTPAKQGLHVPGTHQPILPSTALHDEAPDVLLLLAWNHAEEIVGREQAFVKNGGRFLTPHLIEL